MKQSKNVQTSGRFEKQNPLLSGIYKKETSTDWTKRRNA
jgi:hypothetical protein